MQTVISKLGQKDAMRLGRQRLTEIGVMKSQSLVLDGDHLESMQREAELVKSVKEINEKQREEDRQKSKRETSKLHATETGGALKKFIDEHNGHATKKTIAKTHVCATHLKCCNVSFKCCSDESKTSLVDVEH
jgi:antitoxin component of MazEF toxin-antitoxin module